MYCGTRSALIILKLKGLEYGTISARYLVVLYSNVAKLKEIIKIAGKLKSGPVETGATGPVATAL